MSTRRQLIERGLIAGVGAAGLTRPGIAEALAAAGRKPLDADTIPQFVTTLPVLEVIEASQGRIELRMREFRTQVLPAGMPRTWVWGYLQPARRGDPRTWAR
jgi:spore coat protein A